jgi:hemerythrin
MDNTSGWKDNLEIGVQEIDVEHQLQVRLVESLRDAVTSGQPRETVDALLQSLLDTSNVHFMGEELLMRMHSWERYSQHTDEHRQLLEDLAAMRVSFETGQGAALLATATRVQSWLAHHIRTHDHAFGEYMASGGLGAHAKAKTTRN